MFVDTHIHLTHHLFNGEVPCICADGIRHLGRGELIEQLKALDIAFVVEPGIDFESNSGIIAIAREYPGYVIPVVGIHPTRTPQTSLSKRKEIERLSAQEGVAAIGELGLDYHYDRMKQHRLKQKYWFVWQIKLAHKRGLPLVLHIRNAHDDAIRILRRYRNRINGGVCHCYNAGPKQAEIYTKELGLMLGIGGTLLQEGAEELRKAVIETDLENIVLETDGPYVKPDKPEGLSGKQWKKARNTSMIIPQIARKVAELKGISVDEVERVTTNNAIQLFSAGLGNKQAVSNITDKGD